jgi:phage-related protein (TIGR01555 family)
MSVPTFDGLVNFFSGLGTGKDKTANWQHLYTPGDQQQFESVYATSWLAKKIIDIVPQDMTREWRTWNAEEAEALYAAENDLHLKTKVRQWLTLARLYGGAAILIGDDSGGRDPTQPLDVKQFQQGGLRYLHVFNRFELTPDGKITDLRDPDYGKPEFYRVNTGKIRDLKIHRSRFVFAVGADAPQRVSEMNDGWGLSVLEFIRQVVVNVEAAAMNAAALVEEAKVDVVTIPELDTILSTTDGEQRMIRRWTLANSMKSVINTLMLGGGETFERKQITFGGLPELIHTQMELASGAADVPVTRLLGQSPAGLNSTGESDIRNYYDMIASKQNTDLKENLERLDIALIRHVLGDYDPEEVNYEWAPLWQLDPKVAADTGKVIVETINTLNQTNLFAPEELRGAAIDKLIASEILPTLDQHLLNEEDFAALLGGGDQTTEPDPTDGTPELRVVQGGRLDHDPFR